MRTCEEREKDEDMREGEETKREEGGKRKGEEEDMRWRDKERAEMKETRK